MHESINECYVRAIYFHIQNILGNFLHFLSLETDVAASQRRSEQIFYLPLASNLHSISIK
jgi:hypothetical protein